MSNKKEPYIIINGKVLNTAQAMTVRVAIGNFILDLNDKEYYTDLGEIAPLYKLRLNEIMKILLETNNV